MGDVLVVAPGTAHPFCALGPECLQMVAIYAASRMEMTWLEWGPMPKETMSFPSPLRLHAARRLL